MKLKNSKMKTLISLCSLIILCSLLLSACSFNELSKKDKSIVMVKNSAISTYGTGFAIGNPWQAADTFITSYSVVATQNGAAPKTAEVYVNEEEKKLVANVVFYDAGRNFAVLKLSKGIKGIKPFILKSEVDNSETVYVRGYEGTGNIMSDFEKHTTANIIQYSGNISIYDELQTMLIYKYSNEFNRALVGAPALNKDGYAVGMCAYSLDSMNTYSQYILSSDELMRVLSANGIDYMSSEEEVYKNIITATLILGVLILAGIVVTAVIVVNKNNKENNLNKIKDKYIKATGGALKGLIFKVEDKVVIGKNSFKCDIVIPYDEPGIGDVHCSVQVVDGEYYLVDNFSETGTYLSTGTKIESAFPYKIHKAKTKFYLADKKNSFEFYM